MGVINSLRILMHRSRSNSNLNIINIQEQDKFIWTKNMIRQQKFIWFLVRIKYFFLMKPRKDNEVLSNALKITSRSKINFCLEIGSSNVYISKLIYKLVNPNTFIALDISFSALIQYIKKKNCNYVNADGLSSPFKNSSIDLIIDAASMIHIIDWTNLLEEYLRVSNKYIVLHSVTCADNIDEVQSFEKMAYGKKVKELIFPESILIDFFKLKKWNILVSFRSLEYALDDSLGFNTYSKTLVFQKND